MKIEDLITTLSMDITDALLPWLVILISVIAAIWFKDAATRLAKGITFSMRKAFNAGDIVYIDGEEAIIISIGWRETIFEINRDSGRCWRYIPNTRIEYLKLEKLIK